MTLNKGKQWRILFIFSFAILFLLSSLSIYRYLTVPDKKGNSVNDEIGLSRFQKRGIASLKGFSMTETTDDGTVYKIKAGSVLIRNGKIGFLSVAFQRVVEMEDVAVSLFENNREVISVSSDTSILNIGSKDVLFNGNVIFSSAEGKTLKTDKLFWDNKRKILKTDKRYVYTDKNGSVRTGDGFESDKKLETIKFGKEI